MVRRDEERSEPRSGEGLSSCCASLAGESPVPVGVGAPGSRPQPSGREPDGRAGCRKGLRTERACGPQHEVKPGASSDSQSGSRAAHFTAKATPAALVPKRVGGKTAGLLAWSASCMARHDGHLGIDDRPPPPDTIEVSGTPAVAYTRSVALDDRTCVLVVEAQGTDPLPPEADCLRFLHSLKRTGKPIW